MSPQPNLAALSSLQSISFAGTVYRAVLQNLSERILSTEGNRFHPGRYHMTGETGVLYASLDKETALKEMTRHAALKTLQENLVIGKIKLRLQKILDLTKPTNLSQIKLSRAHLIAIDPTIPQAISLIARRSGFQGILVPSATSSGQNLVIFENNLGEGCCIEIEEVLSFH